MTRLVSFLLLALPTTTALRGQSQYHAAQSESQHRRRVMGRDMKMVKDDASSGAPVHPMEMPHNNHMMSSRRSNKGGMDDGDGSRSMSKSSSEKKRETTAPTLPPLSSVPVIATTPLPTSAPVAKTIAPSAAVPDIAPELQLAGIVQAVQSNSFTNNATGTLMSEDVAFYTTDLVTDKTQPPSVRSTSWVLNDDPRNPAPSDPWLVLRYAIATLYFAFTGEEWTNQENWLTDDHVCGWHGVFCDRFNKTIIEIDLTGNNLAGSIPAEIGLLSDLRSIVLQRNKITGTIPSENFGSLPVLSILFLNDNQLSGDLELIEPLRDNGVLSTMFIQQNNINGRWPRTFCPRSGQEPVFLGFGLDCTNITKCLCCAADNCY